MHKRLLAIILAFFALGLTAGVILLGRSLGEKDRIGISIVLTVVLTVGVLCIIFALIDRITQKRRAPAPTQPSPLYAEVRALLENSGLAALFGEDAECEVTDYGTFFHVTVTKNGQETGFSIENDLVTCYFGVNEDGFEVARRFIPLSRLKSLDSLKEEIKAFNESVSENKQTNGEKQ